MRYLLDADWVISFLNGRDNAIQLVRELADEGLAVSVITYGEIYEGLLARPHPTRHISQLREFSELVDLVTLDLTIARRYAKIRSVLRGQGLLIPDNDLWIAATALARRLTLVSQDRHFARIPELKLYQGGKASE